MIASLAVRLSPDLQTSPILASLPWVFFAPRLECSNIVKFFKNVKNERSTYPSEISFTCCCLNSTPQNSFYCVVPAAS